MTGNKRFLKSRISEIQKFAGTKSTQGFYVNYKRPQKDKNSIFVTITNDLLTTTFICKYVYLVFCMCSFDLEHH